MTIHKIVVGPLAANCYLVVDPLRTFIIDPGDEPEKILDVVNKHGLKPMFIVLTHTHFDHTGALEEIKKKFGIEVSNDGLEIIKTPGHTKDGICIIVGESPPSGEAGIFTGDTLFKNSIGRTDLAGGDFNQIQKSLKRLMQYPDNFKVYPGHGPETTIGQEKQNNPFLQRLTFN